MDDRRSGNPRVRIQGPGRERPQAHRHTLHRSDNRQLQDARYEESTGFDDRPGPSPSSGFRWNPNPSQSFQRRPDFVPQMHRRQHIRGGGRGRFDNSTHTTTRNANSFGQRETKGYFGFKTLQSLLDKNPETLTMELLRGKKGIMAFVNNKLKEDGIVLFVKILSTVTESPFDDTKHKVLQLYLNEPFIDKLIRYIVLLPLKRQERRNNTDEFWYDLIKICRDISDSLPTFARQILPDILNTLTVCFESFEKQCDQHISDEITTAVRSLNEAVQANVKQYEDTRKSNARKRVVEEKYEDPPDDFRLISVYPNINELLTKEVFLRSNVVRGPYRDVNHYLDVHFRLLREDFVAPLKRGIQNYRLDDKKRLENIRVYKKIRFLNPETVNELYCIRLRFDFSKKKKNFTFENSRRFMFGSLLCFTNDDFKSVIFGKVTERNVEDLEKGELVVGFDQSTAVSYGTDYLMVESSVYFEPYYHVLNALKDISTEDFPMEKYIVRVNRDVEPPEYLSPECTYDICGCRFSPLTNWPNIRFYGLNESQLAAFKAALTQEFCIIQGPPGTGKTYLGLKIAQTLLENDRVWCNETPMLVVCFTNHALDQFLEGIAAFTHRIVRIGGQSKNANLNVYNLKNKRRFPSNSVVSEQRSELKTILEKTKNITRILKEIEQYDSVFAFDFLESVIEDFDGTWFQKAKSSEILDWLLEGSKSANGITTPIVVQSERELNNDKDTDEFEESDDENNVDENLNMEAQTDDIFGEINAADVRCSISLETLRSKITLLRNSLEILKENQNPTLEEQIEDEERRSELSKLQNIYDYLNLKLVEGQNASTSRRDPPRDVDLQNPHSIAPDDRWHLYFYWLNLYKEELLEELKLLKIQFRDEYKIFEEMQAIENVKFMKDALVIGMTTTAAARLRCSLQALKNAVVIVEEAAEVVEAHIVSSLTRHCKHLILIGDHQQLKPHTADYRIEKHRLLGISLFERMVINEIQLYTLNVQHRMKPEISSLISPTIYPDLRDHPSVCERSAIMGIDKCLFFIDHQHREVSVQEGSSKKNYHEAEFLIYLARHLILNGYRPENITILAAYLGQMFEMQRLKQRHRQILEGVRIAVLDNYQGEESDIILLSLVRNNDENKIGFLSIENRVCVALSRARDGFYLMGNMTQLCAASELWRKIRGTLENQNAIGTGLALRCQIHRKVTKVATGDDFLKISEGGCDEKCGAILDCAHRCTSLCHVLDRGHKHYQCRETCGKNSCRNDASHLCTLPCYRGCGPCTYRVQRELPCEHVVLLECHIDPHEHACVVPVRTELPCGHVADKPCHRDPETYKCPHPCEVKVEPCGHACRLTCHIRQDPDHLEYKCTKRCSRFRRGCSVETEDHICPKLCYEECEECTIFVRKRRSVCPHIYDVPCNVDVDELKCHKPCTKILSCGHKCKKGICNEPCPPCEAQVTKMIPICGHPVKVKCSVEPDRKLCNKKCPLTLPCGHPCTKQCNEPCTKRCQVKVETAIKSPCGHVISEIKCYLATSGAKLSSNSEILRHCSQPCGVELKCGHICAGTCGECSRGRIHKPCGQQCGFPLICNHPCEFPCRQACRPCPKPCPITCRHNGRVIACSKKCGDVCTPCRERCTRSCEHQRCTRFCGDLCDVPPCEIPCGKTLKCGHRCVGFCGDPCPPKCLICHRDELTACFFGFEDEEGARFVLLEDCGHVFESIGLEQWMKQDEEQIGIKGCPICKTTIKITRRYGDLIKQRMADVAKVKASFYGSPNEINEKRSAVRNKLQLLQRYERLRRLPFDTCLKLLANLKIIKERVRIQVNGRRQAINKSELKALESKLDIMEHVLNICSNAKINSDDDDSKAFSRQMNFVLEAIMRNEDYITDQEIEDVQLELNRLSRIVDLYNIKKSEHFSYLVSSVSKVQGLLDDSSKLLFSTGRFLDEREQEAMLLLKDLSEAASSGIRISEQEKREIVKAMAFKQGHWYKCANGHPYVIGECGGAVVEAKCFCGATIGGSHHRLRSDNALATEMDGATHSAWSEAANMGNYELNFPF